MKKVLIPLIIFASLLGLCLIFDTIYIFVPIIRILLENGNISDIFIISFTVIFLLPASAISLIGFVVFLILFIKTKHKKVSNI